MNLKKTFEKMHTKFKVELGDLDKKLKFNPKTHEHEKLLKERLETITSFKFKMNSRRSFTEKLADSLTEKFGTMTFFVFNSIFFIAWILLNTGFIKAVPIFDPYPFNFLTMTVSLEAIFLSIIVLISQNRAEHIANLREEVDLRVNIRAEEEITRILNIVDAIHDHLGLPPEDDDELKLMKQKTDVSEIENALRAERD